MDLRFLVYTILLILYTEVTNAQFEISGWIIDSTGQVLDGAKITDIAAKNSAIADKNGEFRLTVSDNSLIEISSLGYYDTIIEATKLHGDTIILRMHIYVEGLSVVYKDTRDDTCKFEINIYQQILPYSKWDISYEITSTRIKIYKERSIFIGDKVINQRRKVYRTKLSDMYSDSLKIIVSEIMENNLEGSYSSGALDGINWNFVFRKSCIQKEIYLDNYYLPEIGVFMDYIDRVLPDKEKYISFEYFNTRKIFEGR